MIKNVLSVTRYKFIPENQNSEISGTKIYVAESNVRENNRIGIDIVCYPASYEMFNSFSEVPGNYELNFKTQSTKFGGSPKIVVDSAVKK